jgi:hypothetical protein
MRRDGLSRAKRMQLHVFGCYRNIIAIASISMSSCYLRLNSCLFAIRTIMMFINKLAIICLIVLFQPEISMSQVPDELPFTGGMRGRMDKYNVPQVTGKAHVKYNCFRTDYPTKYARGPPQEDCHAAIKMIPTSKTQGMLLHFDPDSPAISGTGKKAKIHLDGMDEYKKRRYALPAVFRHGECLVFVGPNDKRGYPKNNPNGPKKPATAMLWHFWKSAAKSANSTVERCLNKRIRHWGGFDDDDDSAFNMGNNTDGEAGPSNAEAGPSNADEAGPSNADKAGPSNEDEAGPSNAEADFGTLNGEVLHRPRRNYNAGTAHSVALLDSSYAFRYRITVLGVPLTRRTQAPFPKEGWKIYMEDADDYYYNLYEDGGVWSGNATLGFWRQGDGIVDTKSGQDFIDPSDFSRLQMAGSPSARNNGQIRPKRVSWADSQHSGQQQ